MQHHEEHQYRIFVRGDGGYFNKEKESIKKGWVLYTNKCFRFSYHYDIIDNTNHKVLGFH